ncbi:MAG: acyl-CoA thioesterase [Promethearchaeota archaeon]|nr:MAG: acyl-CoA thioesterase [Candidatus Lokiarchaeota archaeon]
MTNSLETLKIRLLEHQDITKVKVRFNDTDAMGIVHFKNYMVYFDDGFVSFMNSLEGKQPVEQFIHQGLALGVKHVDITYEKPATFGDYILVKTNIDKIGNKSLTFYHELSRESDGEIVAIVKATRFVMDLKTNKLRNVMSFFKNFIQ